MSKESHIMVSIGTARGASRDRSVAVLGALLLALATTAGLAVRAPAAAAEDLPLVLSSEHLGMSAEQIEAAHAPVVEEAPVVLRGPQAAPSSATGSEFVSNESGAVRAGAPASSAGSVSSFGECVERAIRGGVGFDASDRVCRALFPEQG
jgi:hypothetical protein